MHGGDSRVCAQSKGRGVECLPFVAPGLPGLACEASWPDHYWELKSSCPAVRDKAQGPGQPPAPAQPHSVLRSTVTISIRGHFKSPPTLGLQ